MALQLLKIQAIEVASPVTSVTFSNIPQGYTDLILEINSRMSNASVLGYNTIRFNADSGNNYTWTYLDANIGGGPFSSSSSAYSSIFINTPAATASANTFGNAGIYIPNYTGSNYKSASIDGTSENFAAQAFVTIVGGLWKNTAAITSITINDAINSASILSNSTFTLYGVL